MDFVLALSDKMYHLSISPDENNMADEDDGETAFTEHLKEESCDIKLIVGNKTIPAHKSLLVAASEYFRAMFGGDFVESYRKEIAMPGLSESGLTVVIDALYTGCLNLTDDNVLEILSTADQLEMKDILDCCEDFLVSATDTANCFQLLQLSEKYTLPRLNQEIEQFIIRNFLDVCRHPMFTGISQEALVTFISNDELDFREIDIFRGVMNWFDNKNDQKSISEVMAHIRFTFMTSEEIVNEVLTQPIISENDKCKEAIEDKLQMIISYEEEVHLRPILEVQSMERPRGQMCVVAVPPKYTTGEAGRMLNVPAIKQLLFFAFNDDSVNVADKTTVQSKVDFAVFGMNILHMGHSIFFLGAQPLDDDGNDAKMVLFRLNVQSAEWTTLQEPEFPPTVVSVSVFHDDYLYFIGGASYSNRKTIPQTTFKKECYKYSIRDNTWSQICDYPHPVSHPAACVLGREIFVVGGGGANISTQYRDLVFAYDPEYDTWTEKCPLNTGRAGHRICVVDEKIYVLGGRDPYRRDVPECEVYDKSEDLWTVLDKAPIPRSVASYQYVVHNDNITLVGGGCDKETRHPLVQKLSTKSLEWTTYNWEKDHPDLLLSGSMHQLPLLRVRLSCFNTTDNCSEDAAAAGNDSTDCTEAEPERKQSAEYKSKLKHKRHSRHCSTQ